MQLSGVGPVTLAGGCEEGVVFVVVGVVFVVIGAVVVPVAVVVVAVAFGGVVAVVLFFFDFGDVGLVVGFDFDRCGGAAGALAGDVVEVGLLGVSRRRRFDDEARLDPLDGGVCELTGGADDVAPPRLVDEVAGAAEFPADEFLKCLVRADVARADLTR